MPRRMVPPVATAPAFRPPASATAAPVSYSPEIGQALQLLGQIRHLPGDEAYMRSLGVDPIFRGGADALNLIMAKNIRVAFGDMGNTKAHAQWLADQNLIMLNQKYAKDLNRDTLYALSEAIYHEAGHAARLGDNMASLQEEINCLALNTLANRYHAAMDPAYAQSASRSALISDGVALYNKLFFDADPAKQALVNRIIKKYGSLPPAGPDHPIPMTYQPPLADRVCRELQSRRVWNA